VKRLKVILAIIGILFLLSSTVKAQVNIEQPMWAPVGNSLMAKRNTTKVTTMDIKKPLEIIPGKGNSKSENTMEKVTAKRRNIKDI